MKKVSRRRVIKISAAFGATATATGGLLPGAFASMPPRRPPVFEWKGQALGAQTSMQLAHPDRAEATVMLARCRDEIERLEQIFSLYRPESEVSKLNRDGKLDRPSLDLRQCLDEAHYASELTGGAFDITIAPLWRLYADHFASANTMSAPPRAESVATARAAIGYERVHVSSDGIRFGAAGMSITLNGIAQGYITDRIADLLKSHGFTRVLVSLGETRALDGPAAGQPWRYKISEPGQSALRRGRASVVDLENQAIASSAGAGLVFEPTGRFNHLVDPRSTQSLPVWDQVSVAAPGAARADALSTGLVFTGLQDWREILSRAGAHYAIGLPRGAGPGTKPVTVRV